MNGWGLPKSAAINGKEYAINTDFRDVLEVISNLSDPSEHELTCRYVALSLFYERFDEMPESDYPDAFEWMVRFINLGETDDPTPRPKTIDWEQDRPIIVAEINKVAGCEIRALSFLHWWTFVGYFNCIGDGQLALIVSIREKRRNGKKLDDYERDFYNRNRSKIDFKQYYTEAEEALLSAWLLK